jgi:hypothetical protein
MLTRKLTRALTLTLTLECSVVDKSFNVLLAGEKANGELLCSRARQTEVNRDGTGCFDVPSFYVSFISDQLWVHLASSYVHKILVTFNN